MGLVTNHAAQKSNATKIGVREPICAKNPGNTEPNCRQEPTRHNPPPDPGKRTTRRTKKKTKMFQKEAPQNCEFYSNFLARRVTKRHF